MFSITPDYIKIPFLDTEPKHKPTELLESNDIELRKKGIVKRGPKSRKHGWDISTKQIEGLERQHKLIVELCGKNLCEKCHKVFCYGDAEGVKVYDPDGTNLYKLFCDKCWGVKVYNRDGERYHKLLKKLDEFDKSVNRQRDKKSITMTEERPLEFTFTKGFRPSAEEEDEAV